MKGQEGFLVLQQRSRVGLGLGNRVGHSGSWMSREAACLAYWGHLLLSELESVEVVPQDTQW